MANKLKVPNVAVPRPVPAMPNQPRPVIAAAAERRAQATVGGPVAPELAAAAPPSSPLHAPVPDVNSPQDPPAGPPGGPLAAAPELTPDSFMAQQKPAEPQPETVPERPETIATQVRQLGDGMRKAVMLPRGTPPPSDVPRGTKSLETAAGTFLYDPHEIMPEEIHRALADNRLPEILGHARGGLGAPDKSQLQGDHLTVVVRDPRGTEVQATVTDQSNLASTLRQSQKLMPKGGTVALEDPMDVLIGRGAPELTPDDFMATIPGVGLHAQ